MKAIGKKIRKLRELKELTQEYIATEIGLSQSAYSKIEAAETDITYQRLEKIAEILEVKPEDIIAFNEQMIFNLHHNQTAQGFVMHNHISQIVNLRHIHGREDTAEAGGDFVIPVSRAHKQTLFQKIHTI